MKKSNQNSSFIYGNGCVLERKRNMFIFDEKIDSLKSSTKSEKKLKSFFEKGFEKFELDDQFKILELFNELMTRENNGNDWNKFLYHNSEICSLIDERINLKTNLLDNSINYETKIKMIISYFNLVFYGHYSDEKVKVKLKIACDYINNMDFKGVNIKTLNNLLLIVIKQIKVLINDGLSFEKIKLMILFYFENVNSILEEDELLNLLLEEKNIIDVSDILNGIINKVQLQTNENYILKRLKNGVFSKEDCLQILSNNGKLKKYANVDLIKNFLIENGIVNPNVIYDKALFIEGMACGDLIRINSSYVTITSFHEAIHVIQNNDFKENNYYGNRYYMLKDQIIASNIPYQVYRSNYKSLLFEEEAEILGIQSYYQYYKGEKYNIPEILVNNSIVMSDEMEVAKKDLLDSIIEKNPKILIQYPILKVEYHTNGSKKIAKEIVYYLELLNISIADKKAIFECIFNNKYENVSLGLENKLKI